MKQFKRPAVYGAPAPVPNTDRHRSDPRGSRNQMVPQEEIISSQYWAGRDSEDIFGNINMSSQKKKAKRGYNESYNDY